MVAGDDVLKNATEQQALPTQPLFQLFGRPQCACRRVRFLAVGNLFNMSVGATREPYVALKARPTFSQVVPQTSEVRQRLRRSGHEGGGKSANFAQMLVKKVWRTGVTNWRGMRPVF